MFRLLFGVVLAASTFAEAAPLHSRGRAGSPSAQSLYGHWRIVGVAVPRDGVQKLSDDDPHYVGQALTFTPRRLSWDKPNRSYGGSDCVAPVIRPTSNGLAADDRTDTLGSPIVGAFSVRCADGAWGPVDPRATEVLALRDGRIALWWFDDALLTLRPVR